MIGIDSTIDPTAWRLRVIGPSGEGGARLFRLDEIKALPRVEMTTELKCIEGWSTVVNWVVRASGRPRGTDRPGHAEWSPGGSWKPSWLRRAGDP